MPTVLITGASTGIGRATALRLAGAGWTVLAGVRKLEDGARLVEEAEVAGRMRGESTDPGSPGAGRAAAGAADAAGRVVPLTLDVTDAEQIVRAAELVDEHASQAGQPSRGGLDALVNNAGIGFGGPLELVPIEDLRRQFEVNVLGHVAVTQAMLPALRRAHGRIVFVSSVGGRVAMAFTAPYAASKHAIEAIGDALRVELRSSNVQVALVEPGSVATPIWDKSRAQGDGLSVPAELTDQYGHVPAAMGKVLKDTERRGIPPEQVAETIEQALTARRMKARYLIGRDAKAMLLAKRLLPDHVFDRVARRALGV
jgi:NAD(P)-dependent dehydrogenase (short-subunit alcohol dehydrogenase family)